MAEQRDASLRLACAESLGVVAVSPAAWAALCEMHGRVAAVRSAGTVFTTQALAALAADAGFAGDTALAARALAEAGAGGGAGAAVALDVPHFAGYMAAAAAAAQVDDARVADYLKVFYLLHTSGIRESAGVAAT